jgi:hypothetical protein
MVCQIVGDVCLQSARRLFLGPLKACRMEHGDLRVSGNGCRYAGHAGVARSVGPAELEEAEVSEAGGDDLRGSAGRAAGRVSSGCE